MKTAPISLANYSTSQRTQKVQQTKNNQQPAFAARFDADSSIALCKYLRKQGMEVPYLEFLLGRVDTNNTIRHAELVSASCK
ncbi:MAG: hypothetical protein PHC64_10715 [Candidatus Gastranaerophilales bacterium]|nr:hypothetical protein [Candidatus Gastranaerophilales bacterium]